MAPVQQIRSAAHAAALVLAAALSGFAQTPSGWPCGRDEAKLVASECAWQAQQTGGENPNPGP